MTTPKMTLEEAATRLHTMSSFYHGLGVLEEIIETARSVDNIKNLTAERMAAAESALKKVQAAQAKLADLDLAFAKKQKELEAQSTAVELYAKQRMVDLDNEFEMRKRGQEDDMTKMRQAFEANASALSNEIAMLTSARDDMTAQVDKIEASLAALRTKVEGLL